MPTSTANADIRKTILNHFHTQWALAGYSNAKVRYPNVPMDCTRLDSWAAFDILETATERASFGATLDKGLAHLGTVQVTLYVRAGQGFALLSAMADAARAILSEVRLDLGDGRSNLDFEPAQVFAGGLGESDGAHWFTHIVSANYVAYIY